MQDERTFSETAVFISHEQPMEFRMLPIPALRPGEILIRNEYTTLCRSDLFTFCGKRFEKTPTILGHEIAGRIAAFGPETAAPDLRGAPLAAGDRVSWAIFASDPESELSRRGIPQKGDKLFKYGHEQLTEDSVLHGGLSQYTLLKPNTPVLKVDESVPLPLVALLNCTVSTIAGAMRLAGNVSGRNVLISGAGMLGAMACAMCKTAGAAKVVALDIQDERLEKAKLYGADVCFRADGDLAAAMWSEFGQANPVDVVIEVSGMPEAIEQTFDLLGTGGTAVWVGATFPQRNVGVNAEKIVRKLLTIKGLHNYNTQDFITAVAFMEKHHLDFPFADMIHEHFSLREANEAFAYALQANPFRVGVRID